MKREEAEIGGVVFTEMYALIDNIVKEITVPGVIRDIKDTYAVCDFMEPSDKPWPKIVSRAVEYTSLRKDR